MQVPATVGHVLHLVVSVQVTHDALDTMRATTSIENPYISFNYESDLNMILTINGIIYYLLCVIYSGRLRGIQAQTSYFLCSHEW